MGDHRAEIHCQFTIHGKTYKLDLGWINYYDDGGGVDYRVMEFFRESWDDAKRRYEQKIYDEAHEDIN